MILKLKSFKTYNKFFQAVNGREGEFYSSVYFDFKGKIAYSLNAISQMKIPFDYEIKEAEELPKNCFIDKTMLFNLISLSEDLEFKDYQFKIGKDIFKIPYIVDEDDFVEYNYDNFTEKLDITVDMRLLNILKKVNSIIPINDDQKRAFQGVFIRGNKIIVTDRQRFADLQFECSNDIDISYDIIKFISLCNDNEKVDIFYNDNSYKFVIDEVIQIVVNKALSIEFNFDINGKDFKKNYMSDDYFTVSEDDIKVCFDVLKIFKPSLSKDSIYIEVTDNIVSFVIDDPVNKIYSKKDITVSEVTEGLKGLKIKASFDFLLETFNILSAKNYKFMIHPDSKVPTFNIIDSDRPENHMVIMKQRMD